MSLSESQRERRGILAKLLLAVAIMGLGATTARAQTPSPAGGGDFASEMARLVERAAELVPLIRDQVESPLMGEFEKPLDVPSKTRSGSNRSHTSRC